MKGTWEADHVIQKAKGGAKSADNCLPACVWCNRLRWHRKGAEIRGLLKAGLIVKKEIDSKSSLGLAVSKLLKKKESANVKRRRSI